MGISVLVGVLSAAQSRAGTGFTTRVSVGSAGYQGNGECRYPSISGDGRYVAFESAASNLVTGDTNAAFDVFMRRVARRASSDFDGEGKTDVAVWRPLNGTWYVSLSSGAPPLVVQWGDEPAGDIPVPGNLDGDGNTDFAV